ncbi:hypothetical protein THAOC_14025 [Thalassiosira oceanica]|uniref:Uncharacterized protein n=1 Tax=Thalassiosira oceanica TaxID=159749 RepID=K0SGB5_THAOC|nr:hypothetical protein THAOC_14025 [Thalassiosira oceanica]|eukprot:EJK65158.1 hypothetical protein THAOC_14025 [Thalassiosira oceanica]
MNSRTNYSIRASVLSKTSPCGRSSQIFCIDHKKTTFNHGEDSIEEGSLQGRQEGRFWRQEEEQEARRVLLDVHLQGAQAGPPRHRNQQEGNEHHELLHQRHLRAHRRGGRQARHLQQEGHPLVPRDPDRRPPHASRRARQARRVRGNQGRDQVLLRLSVDHHA